MNAVVAFALRQRVLIVVLLFATMGVGLISFLKLNIEAYPDPVPPLVDIVTQSPGQSAEEMERYITIPIEVAMAGTPNVKTIRTISLFGLSDVKVQFTYDFTYYQAEQFIINRLAQMPPLANNAQPAISPVSPTGEIYRYRVVGPAGFTVTDLKTIQDWMLERRFKAVPGVIDVIAWGGRTKTYDVTLDLKKVTQYGLTVPQIVQVLNNSNINVGGQTVNFGPQAAVVRGIGQIHTLDNIRSTTLSAPNGAPVLLRDVADISVGHKPRLGIAGQDADDDIVQGIVLMRRGQESLPTLERVKAEVDRINNTGLLPPGVRIEKIYDRTDLINVTTRTVLHNMVMGIILIFFVQWIFLGNLRSAIIVATTIPFALFFAVAILVLRGESANLLSVGAIDFGLIVDATVIMVENIYRHLCEPREKWREGPHGLEHARMVIGLHGRLNRIALAAAEVNGPIFFSAAIIIAAFVPLFTMSGIEGHIFGPMAKTYAYAIVGGMIATFTVSPALSALLLQEKVAEAETVIVRGLRRAYAPLLEFALANRIVALGLGALAFAAAAVMVAGLGLEFLPKLEEGNLWIRATMPPSISLEEANGHVNRMRNIIRSFPEAVTVISQNGRPDDGTDATGFFNAEFYVPLKPKGAWRRGMDKDTLTDQVNAALQAEFPGVEFNFSQNIQDNVEEAASGVKGENSIKLYGNDLPTLEAKAAQIREVMRTVRGVADLAVLNSLGQPTVRIDIDRERAARYGLAPGDINATVQAAIGGQAAGNLYEEGSDRNFPMVVRLAPEYRSSLDAIRRITVGVQNQAGSVTQVPLGQVADVRLESGASFIYREQQQRYIPIKFSVRGRDLGGAVLEAQAKVQEQVELPGNYRVEWVGEFGNLKEAAQRLAIAVPLSILLICVLLYFHFNSIVDMLLAASVVPMALVGGVFGLYLTGTPFSVSAAIGFVALFGIAAMDGIIVISYYNQLLGDGVNRAKAIRQACEVQMRPVVMTCIAAGVGLLPAAVSTGIGAQVQRPLAIVVVGGVLLAPVLILVVLPALIAVISRRRPARRPDGTEDAEMASA
jgi:cobalt-zinc-cadmium resistance protein CzcA